MGGNNEFVAPPKPTKSEIGSGSMIGAIRIHENRGEVHFHDDNANRKVAVPVAEMYTAWDKLKNGHIKKFKYTDYSNNTILKMRVKEDKRISDLEVRVLPLNKQISNQTTEFAAFDKLMKASHG